MDVDSCYLDGNADAVEFCPCQPFHHILAAGTYTLQEGTQPHRLGSISLFSTDPVVGLQLLCHVPTVGVFDIKWSTIGDSMHPLLAQAGADGGVTLYKLELKAETSEGNILTESCSKKIGSSMCLCMDWKPLVGSIALGLSDGSISLVTIGQGQLQVSESWMGHDYEVWATCFDAHRPNLLYTGSDDCCFSCWDLRAHPSDPVFRNAKSHQMGVCCISQNPTNSNILLTGSYDEFLRVWDLRSTSKPVCERSLCLGGGVWRVKYHPYISNFVLAACMHNGFAIVSIKEENIEVVETYCKHESLAYGADWQKGSEDMMRKGLLVATCSFYDRLLCLWQPDILK
ncbi:diphthine methyltransferase [Canna indica]|uniref:methylated diphthine methylhydrolase n=1 Tax=Canna indica TaxID=4628 RepID=A0AAQ3K6V2_9LILI|nr:diphthine methyltransferase [Canna indica]